MKNHDVEKYLSNLDGFSREWMQYFIEYMRNNYCDIEEVISFQMPTYKLGSGKTRNYISFSVAKNHFSMHTMDFEYITYLKTRLKNPGKGKGCVNALFVNDEEKIILLEAIDDIINRRVLNTYNKKSE